MSQILQAIARILVGVPIIGGTANRFLTTDSSGNLATNAKTRFDGTIVAFNCGVAVNGTALYGGNPLTWYGGAAGTGKISYGTNGGLQAQSTGNITNNSTQRTTTGTTEEQLFSDNNLSSGNLVNAGDKFISIFKGNWAGNCQIRIFVGTNGDSSDFQVYDSGMWGVAASSNPNAPLSASTGQPMYGFQAEVHLDTSNGSDLFVNVRFDCGDYNLTSKIPNCENSVLSGYDSISNPTYISIYGTSADAAGDMLLNAGSITVWGQNGDYTL